MHIPTHMAKVICIRLVLFITGLLVKQEGGKGNFAALKRAFRLLVDDVDDKTPTDIAYVFSGYAPLSVSAVGSMSN